MATGARGRKGEGKKSTLTDSDPPVPTDSVPAERQAPIRFGCCTPSFYSSPISLPPSFLHYLALQLPPSFFFSLIFPSSSCCSVCVNALLEVIPSNKIFVWGDSSGKLFQQPFSRMKRKKGRLKKQRLEHLPSSLSINMRG